MLLKGDFMKQDLNKTFTLFAGVSSIKLIFSKFIH